MRRVALLIVVLLACATWSFGRQARAGDEPYPSRRGHAAIVWVGAVMTNVVYLPLKLVYAGTGGLVGGLAYMVTAGDEAAFFGVWNAAGRGTYLITPGMLDGNEAVHLVGP